MLTTENGMGTITNRIYIESEVRGKLVENLDEFALSTKLSRLGY